MPGHLFSYAVEENVAIRLQIELSFIEIVLILARVNFLMVHCFLLNCSMIQTKNNFMQLLFVLHWCPLYFITKQFPDHFVLFPLSLWSAHRMGISATCWASATKGICGTEKCWCHLLHEFCHSAAVHDSSHQEWDSCNRRHRQWCRWWHVWGWKAGQWGKFNYIKEPNL